jgi:hypothetical protein
MPEITITGWDTRDVRFPTSLDKTGSDAMNAAGDYSAAYCILKTDSKFSGHGMVALPLPTSPTSLPKQNEHLTDFCFANRHSPSAVETTSSAKQLTTSPTASKAEPFPPSSKTGARHGVT